MCLLSRTLGHDAFRDRAVEHRCRVFGTDRLSNQQADVGRSGAVSVHLAREQEREASNENIRPPRGLGPLGRQNSSLLAPREGEGGSGDGSILRIYPSDAAELNQLLMEVKIRVCQTEDSVLELTVSRDGRALVPGGSEHVSRRDGVELLRAGGLGDPVQAELGHLGERVVLLGNQVRGAAVPSRECPGETGQPEREGKGGAAPVEVPEGARA